MKLSNPLRNFLTPGEQKILLYVSSVILFGCLLDAFGFTPLQAQKTDTETLKQAVQVDVPLNLDIRSAELDELQSLPGIGPKRAADIIAYRTKKPFTAVNQLLDVKGIGPKTYAKLLPNLLAFGDTLAPPKTEKQSKSKASQSSPKSELTNPVNLNTASEEQLCSLIGIGPAKAKAIIAWRNENGSFGTIEDFTKVKGIGVKTLEKNRQRLRVGKAVPDKLGD